MRKGCMRYKDWLRWRAGSYEERAALWRERGWTGSVPLASWRLDGALVYPDLLDEGETVVLEGARDWRYWSPRAEDGGDDGEQFVERAGEVEGWNKKTYAERLAQYRDEGWRGRLLIEKREIRGDKAEASIDPLSMTEGESITIRRGYDGGDFCALFHRFWEPKPEDR